MREPLAIDVIVFARVLMKHAPESRLDVADSILLETERAYGFWQSHRRVHANFGDGSLISRCQGLDPAPEPMASNPDFLDALAVAAIRLRSHLSD
ncbi:MAG: hypothetical protein HC844_12015 [Tabrizicola sp.]|nr:hypothetical protein [Tabrizicola sp.]